jgi:hypothetical protein
MCLACQWAPKKKKWAIRSEVAFSFQWDCDFLADFVARHFDTALRGTSNPMTHQQQPRGARGRQKKIDGPPRTFAKFQTHPPTIRLFFLDFCFSTFLGVSRQGEFKNTIKIFLQKVHVENFSQKNRQKNSCQFFPRFFFVLSRFRVFLSDGSSKTLQKNVLQKKSKSL